MNEFKTSGFSQGLRVGSATQMEELGTIRKLQDGREFVYIKAGAAALAAGKMACGPAVQANHIELVTGAAYAVGATRLAITVGATAVTANQYAGGQLQVNKVAATGYGYTIQENTACDASGVTYVTLAEPIAVALTALSEVSLIPSPFNGAVETDVEESIPVGVSMAVIPANGYGWAQKKGLGVCLVKGTPAAASYLTLTNTAGALTGLITTTTTGVLSPIVGQIMAVGVDAEYKPVMLLLP